jgi:hypothetical protein
MSLQALSKNVGQQLHFPVVVLQSQPARDNATEAVQIRRLEPFH